MRLTRRAPQCALASLIAAAALGLAATSALATPLRPVASSIVALSSDGVRYAAYETRAGAPLVVLDTSSGRRTSVPMPAGCLLVNGYEGGLFATSAEGQALITCSGGREEALLDERSGAVRSLPGTETAWGWLGTRYVRGNEKGENTVVFDLATGSVKRIGNFEYVDLDEPEAPGPSSACPALRPLLTRQSRAMVVGGGVAAAYEDGVFAGPLGNHGNVQIARCSGARTVLRGQRVRGVRQGGPRDFDVRGGVLSWDTGVAPEEVDEEEIRPRGFAPRVEAVSLASGRRRSWKLPRRYVERTTGAFGYSTHTSNTVFWVATRTAGSAGEAGPMVETYSLFSASL